MNLNEAITSLLKRIGLEQEEREMHLPEEFRKLIQMLEKTQEIEYSCDEVYNILDQYTELVYQSENAQELMPLVEHHIEICPDCREEFEALRDALRALG